MSPAGEKQRRNDERIRSQRDALCANFDHGLIVQLPQSGIVKRRQKQIADQLRRQPASASMAQHDGLVLRNRQRARKRERSIHQMMSSSPSMTCTMSQRMCKKSGVDFLNPMNAERRNGEAVFGDVLGAAAVLAGEADGQHAHLRARPAERN